MAGNLCSDGGSHANIIGDNCIVDGDITVGGSLSQQVGTCARDAKFQVAGQGEDPAFIESVRQASYDELMAWYADWVAGRNE